jgi:hypothetical protein
MLEGVNRLIDHIIDLTIHDEINGICLLRKIKRKTLMRLFVLLSGSAPLIAHFNFSTRDANVRKQNKLIAKKII